MSNRRARLLRGWRLRARENARAWPGDDWFAEERNASEDWRRCDTQRRLGAHGMGFDALQALDHEPRDRCARAHCRREHALLRGETEERNQQRKHTQSTSPPDDCPGRADLARIAPAHP